MFAFSKIKSWIFVGILCVVITTIYIKPVTADNNVEPLPNSLNSNMPTNKTLNNVDSPDPSCIPCPDTKPVCPTCPPGVKCVLSVRTCRTCPQASCESKSSGNDSSSKDKNTDKVLLPAIIGSVLGAIVLIVAGFGYVMFRRNSRKNRGTRLEETSSTNSENVIPIAYIPSTTVTMPENTYLGPNASISRETLIDLAEDEDTSCEVGTILQATKASPVATTANTATLITATRVKPALVRINTIKSNNGSANSIRSNSNDPLSTDKSLLNTPVASSIQETPTITKVVVGNDNVINEVPRIDIERSSGESVRPSTQVASSSRQCLNSPFVDPIEGRQSFGLFGSDEVYSTGPATPQLQRESTVSSNSTNGRSTMFSDEGDGEITIFWGGNDAPFMPVTAASTATPNKSGERQINLRIDDPSKNTTNTKEEKT